MPREIIIEVGAEKTVATLLDNKAPITCNAIWNALPLEGQAIHAKIAGGEFWLMVPLFQDVMENPTKEQEPGNVCFWAIRQTIPIFYEKVPGLAPLTLWARITENIEGIRREGRKIWMKEGVRIRMKRKGEH